MASMLAKLLPSVSGLYTLLVARRRLVLACFAACTLILSFISTKMQFTENLVDLLPSDYPLVRDYKSVIENFNPLDMVTMVVTLAEGGEFSMDKLIPGGDEVYTQLEGSGLFQKITYRFDAEQSAELIGLMYTYRAALFTDDDAAWAKERVDDDQIVKTVSRWREQLSSSPAPYLSKVFYDDPLNLSQGLLKRLEKLHSYASEFHFYMDRIFSKDQRYLILIAHPIASVSDSKFSKTLVSTFDGISKNLAAKGYKFSYMSGHRFAAKNADEIRSDVEFASLLSLVGILLLAMATFKRRLLPILTLIPLAFGSVFAFAILYVYQGSMPLIAIACGSLLVGVAVDYGIHILYHLDQHPRFDSDAISHTMQVLFKPIVMSSLTTICAFICLQISLLPAYKEFSTFATLGLLGSLICAVLILPILSRGPYLSQRQPWWDLTTLYAPCYRYLGRSKRSLIGIILVITVLSAFGLPRLRFDGDLQHLYATSAEIEADLKAVNSAFGDAMSTTSVVVSAETLEGALTKNDQVSQLLATLQKEGAIGSYSSIADFLPSIRTQDTNLERWRSLWSDDEKSLLEARLTKHKDTLKLKPEFSEHILNLLNAPAERIGIDLYQGTPLQLYLENHIALKDRTYVLTTLRSGNPQTVETLSDIFAKHDVDAIVINARHFVQSMVALVFGEMQKIGLVTIVAVLLILVIFYGVRASMPMVLPLLLSLIWSFGFLGLFGVPINLLNCVICLFVFGLVIDYSVFLVSALLSGEDSDAQLATSFASIVMSALTTIIGVGALAVADHPALQSIGVTTLIGISCGLMAITLVLGLMIKSHQAQLK